MLVLCLHLCLVCVVVPSKVTVDPNPPPEVRGADRMSTMDYVKAGAAVFGAAALLGGGAVAYDQYSRDQAYVSPDGPTNALALEEGRPE